MSPTNRRAWRVRATFASAAVAVAAIVCAVAPAPLAAQSGAVAEDPALEQQIDREQQISSVDAVLEVGHVDIGPHLVDGALTLLVHDDATTPPVWRSLDHAAIRVRDAAIETVPNDPAYSFVGAAPGAPVHVVPQVQRAGVIWVGWNTQDPAVMERVDRGVTLTLLGVEGPGRMTVFLQAGDLGAPDVLWRSDVASPQPIWVEVNTHTHANWVFTEPGVYLVSVEASADLVGGGTVRDVRTLRIAVGDATDPVDALRATAPERTTAPGAAAARADEVTRRDAEGGGIGGLLVAVVVAGAALLVAFALVSRGRSARARNHAGRAGSGRAAEEV